MSAINTTHHHHRATHSLPTHQKTDTIHFHAPTRRPNKNSNKLFQPLNHRNRIKTTAQILNLIPVPPHSSSNIQNQHELLENQNGGEKFNEVLLSLVRSQRFSTKIIITERFSFAFSQFKSKGRSQENWRKKRREIEEESNRFEEEEV
jgi:branched-subunit amino acid aminotransferase/4-amino-4-deoxychorismate lyase